MRAYLGSSQHYQMSAYMQQKLYNSPILYAGGHMIKDNGECL